jgi:hypothetical protein
LTGFQATPMWADPELSTGQLGSGLNRARSVRPGYGGDGDQGSSGQLRLFTAELGFLSRHGGSRFPRVDPERTRRDPSQDCGVSPSAIDISVPPAPGCGGEMDNP